MTNPLNQANMNPLPPAPPLPLNSYYDSASGKYLIADDDGNWMPVDTGSLKLRLKLKGLTNKVDSNQTVSSIDTAIVAIQQQRNVQYVGSLAGFACGLHLVNGAKVLVTYAPNMFEPKQGDWSLIRAVIENQLEGHNQVNRFHAWLKMADTALRSCLKTSEVTYGQALILVGPPSCGKSLLQYLITEIFGGRSAGPYRYMAGITPFNRELFGAEHLMIEDEQPFKDTKSRVRFGDAIKHIAATVGDSCHGKNREAIKLTPFWRLTLSVNDQPEHLEILPPFNESVLDKIILLYCLKRPMPMPSGTPEEKSIFWKALKAQLPAYIWWLQNEHVIAPEMYYERFGIQPFFHPHVANLIADLAPETRLMLLIDQVFFQDSLPEWEGTAEEFGRRMYESDYKLQARAVIPAEAGPGKLLGKLAKLPEPRVFDVRTDKCRLWRIVRCDGSSRSRSDTLKAVSDGVPLAA